MAKTRNAATLTGNFSGTPTAKELVQRATVEETKVSVNMPAQDRKVTVKETVDTVITDEVTTEGADRVKRGYITDMVKRAITELGGSPSLSDVKAKVLTYDPMAKEGSITQAFYSVRNGGSSGKRSKTVTSEALAYVAQLEDYEDVLATLEKLTDDANECGGFDRLYYALRQHDEMVKAKQVTDKVDEDARKTMAALLKQLGQAKFLELMTGETDNGEMELGDDEDE